MVRRLANVLRRIIRGCGDLPGYGPHPGTPVLVVLIGLGAIAGLGRAGWRGGLFGALVMGVIFGSMYLYGAYDREQLSERAAEQERKLRSKEPS